MKKLSLVIIFLFILQSCSSPLDKKYSKTSLSEDAKEIKDKAGLSEEELQIMAGWIAKAELTGESLEGKTYHEILAEANDFEKQQENLAKKTKLEEEERRRKMGSTLTVALYDKGYAEYDYQDYLTYSLAFENNSQKDIRAFKGVLTINDLFDTEITSINLTIDETIPSGTVYRGTYTTDYNQFRDEDVRLRNKDIEDLKIVWTPEKILFEDGTFLE